MATTGRGFGYNPYTGQYDYHDPYQCNYSCEAHRVDVGRPAAEADRATRPDAAVNGHGGTGSCSDLAFAVAVFVVILIWGSAHSHSGGADTPAASAPHITSPAQTAQPASPTSSQTTPALPPSPGLPAGPPIGETRGSASDPARTDPAVVARASGSDPASATADQTGAGSRSDVPGGAALANGETTDARERPAPSGGASRVADGPPTGTWVGPWSGGTVRLNIGTDGKITGVLQPLSGESSLPVDGLSRKDDGSFSCKEYRPSPFGKFVYRFTATFEIDADGKFVAEFVTTQGGMVTSRATVEFRRE